MLDHICHHVYNAHFAYGARLQTNAYFVVATEAFDDTGLPHTLEHLTFLGSKSYPYKGVLDNLASRTGAYGTSAWTGVDHTAYTITCAGSEGLQMLPIFFGSYSPPYIDSSRVRH